MLSVHFLFTMQRAKGSRDVGPPSGAGAVQRPAAALRAGAPVPASSPALTPRGAVTCVPRTPARQLCRVVPCWLSLRCSCFLYDPISLQTTDLTVSPRVPCQVPGPRNVTVRGDRSLKR